MEGGGRAGSARDCASESVIARWRRLGFERNNEARTSTRASESRSRGSECRARNIGCNAEDRASAPQDGHPLRHHRQRVLLYRVAGHRPRPGKSRMSRAGASGRCRLPSRVPQHLRAAAPWSISSRVSTTPARCSTGARCAVGELARFSIVPRMSPAAAALGGSREWGTTSRHRLRAR